MAHTKAGGSTALGRDSAAKRLGVKVFGGQQIQKGEIIVRQRGTAFRVGKNVKIGSDDTLYAKVDGIVKFTTRSKLRFTGQQKRVKIVSVIPAK